MRKLIIALAFVCLGSGCANTTIRDYSQLPFGKVTACAVDLAEKADIVINYLTQANKFDIGIGREDGGVYDYVLFDYNQLEHFFRSQKHKDLIVIVFSKNKWSEDEIQSKAKEMNLFFFRVGYNRVVIQQGYGAGRGIWSDKTNPQQKL
ncbi:MAG: hypothetical protein WCI95_11375 [bacterium]